MDFNNTLFSVGPQWAGQGFQAFKIDAGELSRTLWGRVFVLTGTWHLVINGLGLDRLSRPVLSGSPTPAYIGLQLPGGIRRVASCEMGIPATPDHRRVGRPRTDITASR